MEFHTFEQVLWYLQNWNQEHPNELVIHQSFVTDNWAGYNDFGQVYRIHLGLVCCLVKSISEPNPEQFAYEYGTTPSEKECLRTNILCLQRSPQFENFRYMLIKLLLLRGRVYFGKFLEQVTREKVGQAVKAFEDKEAKEAADASL